MAVTERNVTSTGATSYTFPFEYLKTTDVKVSVNGTASTQFTVPNGAPTTVQFNTGHVPASGAAIRIYRDTDSDNLSATFYAGSAIKSQDLNDNFNQNLYVTQEAKRDVQSAWQTGDETIISSETWQSDNTKVATTGAIDGRVDAKIDTAIASDVLAGTDLAKTTSGGQVTINHNVSGANSTVNNSNGTVIQDISITAQGHVTSVGSFDLDGRYYTETELNAGQLNNLYYTETELNAGQLDNRYYTETELNAGQLDNRYFTETESDARYYRLGSGGEIQSGETWVAADDKIATTQAIDARITDLVDDIGGFVPIANETSFPNANPDVNNGVGTLLSIKALSSNLTSNGSGVATIANGTVGNSTVTITGLDNSTTYAATTGMLVESTTTLNTYSFHRVTPKATEVTTVATNMSAITTVNSNLTNINSVNSNASNINSAVSNASNINAAVSNASNINSAVANASNINSAASNITNINAVGNNANNINAVAGQILFSEDLGGIADSIATGTGNNINTVASNLASVNSFASTYRISASAPNSSLDEGDLWYDSTANVLKYYNGTTWTVTAAAGLSAVSEDTSPGLGGHLDCNDKNLTEVGTVRGNNLQIDFGTLS